MDPHNGQHALYIVFTIRQQKAKIHKDTIRYDLIQFATTFRSYTVYTVYLCTVYIILIHQIFKKSLSFIYMYIALELQTTENCSCTPRYTKSYTKVLSKKSRSHDEFLNLQSSVCPNLRKTEITGQCTYEIEVVGLVNGLSWRVRELRLQ